MKRPADFAEIQFFGFESESLVLGEFFPHMGEESVIGGQKPPVSGLRKDNAPENFAVLRHIALNMLKKEGSLKKSIKTNKQKVVLTTHTRL